MSLRNSILRLLALVCLLLTGCDYEVPLTAKPTRTIDERFLGNWISPEAWMKVRRFDGENYVIYYNGDAYRAWHSTVAGLPLLTLQSIESKETKYAYLTAALSNEGNRLALRLVRDEVVSKKAGDSAAMQKIIEQHRSDPELFGDEVPFSRMK